MAIMPGTISGKGSIMAIKKEVLDELSERLRKTRKTYSVKAVYSNNSHIINKLAAEFWLVPPPAPQLHSTLLPY
jgi:hypothetical protein